MDAVEQGPMIIEHRGHRLQQHLVIMWCEGIGHARPPHDDPELRGLPITVRSAGFSMTWIDTSAHRHAEAAFVDLRELGLFVSEAHCGQGAAALSRAYEPSRVGPPVPDCS